MSQRKLLSPPCCVTAPHPFMLLLPFPDFTSKNKEEKQKVQTNPFRGGWRHSLCCKQHWKLRFGREIIQDLWNSTSNLLPELALCLLQMLNFQGQTPWAALKNLEVFLDDSKFHRVNTQMTGTQPRLSRVSVWRDPKQISELGGEGGFCFNLHLKHYGAPTYKKNPKNQNQPTNQPKTIKQTKKKPKQKTQTGGKKPHPQKKP